MVTAESVKAKLQGLIDTANAATGNADADLTAAVNALAAGFGQGGGGGEDTLRALVEGTFAGAFVDDTITTIRNGAFWNCKGLTSVSCQNVTSVGENAFGGCGTVADYGLGLNEVNLPAAVTAGNYAFQSCFGLRVVNMPSLKTIGTNTFFNIHLLTELNLPELTAVASGGIRGCSALASVNLPKVARVDGTAFYGDRALTSIDFPLLESIEAQAFASCSKLSTLILRKNSVCTLSNTSAFNSTPFASNGSGGTVYVPAALVASYQSATNWSMLYAGGKCTFAAIEGSEYE